MARSYFALFSGVMPPQAFKAQTAPELLTISDVWEAARKAPPSLLFRVRSESDPGVDVTTEDRLESCVGVVDGVTRWRSVFNMARQMVSSIRHPGLRGVAGNAMQFISTQHPANISQDQRLQIVDALLASPPEGQPGPSVFERYVAHGISRIVAADNDYEAAHYIPFVEALNPFNPDEQRQEYASRAATIETMSGGVLLTEAAQRLSERVPGWLHTQMPALEIAGADETPRPDREERD